MAISYQKNILRTFKGRKSRFIAIFAIVALGVGFLAGLLSTTPDMEDSMEEYLDGGNLFDLRVVSTLGLTDDDVAALEQVDGVAKVQGGKSADLLVEQDGSELVCRVHALPADPEGEDVINRLTLADGRHAEPQLRHRRHADAGPGQRKSERHHERDHLHRGGRCA